LTEKLRKIKADRLGLPSLIPSPVSLSHDHTVCRLLHTIENFIIEMYMYIYLQITRAVGKNVLDLERLPGWFIESFLGQQFTTTHGTKSTSYIKYHVHRPLPCPCMWGPCLLHMGLTEI